MSIYSTYRFIVKQAEPLHFEGTPQKAVNTEQNVLTRPQITANLNTMHPVGEAMYLPTQTHNDVANGKYPWMIFPQDEKAPDMWDDMRNVANKAHLMQWYMSNRGEDKLAPFEVMSTSQFGDHYQADEENENKERVRFSRRSLLPVMGHEWGHNWHRKKEPERFFPPPMQAIGIPSSNFARKFDTSKYDDQLTAERKASFRYLPLGMQSLKDTDRDLYSSFRPYANRVTMPAYKHYLMSYGELPEPTDGRKGYLNSINEQFSAPIVQNQDNMLYNAMLLNAIKNGYDPSTSWGRDPLFTQQPKEILDPRSSIYKDNTILNLPRNSFGSLE